MLNGISWGNFFTAVVIFVFCYYLVVIMLYYRTELMQFIRSGFKRQNADAEEEVPNNTASFAAYENIIKAVDEVIEQAGKGVGKQELISALRPVIANYSNLKEPGYAAAVLNHTIKKSESISGVWISVQELVGDD